MKNAVQAKKRPPTLSQRLGVLEPVVKQLAEDIESLRKDFEIVDEGVIRLEDELREAETFADAGREELRSQLNAWEAKLDSLREKKKRFLGLF